MDIQRNRPNPAQTNAANNSSPADSASSNAANQQQPSSQIAASNEVPAIVRGRTGGAQQADQAATSAAQGADAASAVQDVRLSTDFGTITTTQLQAGDLVFKAGTERSNNTYQTQMRAQEKNISNNTYTTNHQNSLPVELHKVNHCDVAMGDGRLAKVGGARSNYEYAKLGRATPTHFLPVAKIERDTDNDYMVLRPNNPEVAKNMASTAKRHIDREDSHFSVPKLLKAWIFPADKGEKQTPSLTGQFQGPQPKPIEIPKATFCTEYISQVVISGERETLRENRQLLEKESVSFPKLSPPELMDTLIGSGNFTFYNLDRGQNRDEE